MKILQIVVVLGLALTAVGYQIGEVKGFKQLNRSGASVLYEIESPQIQDGRPMKLIELSGTHFEVGYAYGALLGEQIIFTYDIFLTSQLKNAVVRHIFEMFLDWQYDNFIVKNIPSEFLQEMKGLQSAGSKVHHISKLRNLVERILVVNSYPGDIGPDVMYAMLDVFIEKVLRIQNPRLLDYLEANLFKVAKTFRHFMSKKRIHCSFMAAWGSKTQGNKLYTMRNLDWDANTGINKNKLIFIWKVKGTIPHATIGFPGMTGAVAGISQAGITVHEAGLDSMKETQLGTQWTLRLRYILMHAHNLKESREIWDRTQNTFGMNHMIASAADVPTGEAPVFVAETMRGYTAFFKDKDPREDGVMFIDPKTKKSFRAGYAMKDIVFRTNHAYDPTINKFRTVLPTETGSTMHRYMILKDSLNYYASTQMGELDVLNVTANVAHKGGQDFYKCPEAGKDNGTNIISAVFIPGEQRMYVAMEYGSGSTYRTACCGVYLNLNLAPWFASKESTSLTSQTHIQ